MAAARRTRIVALDHISAAVRDLKAARKFYGAALGAIGMKINMDVGSAFGMGSRTQKLLFI
jgi:catechol 2,3-dioxygenase-like lactoylglutathione lyase family enzyme